MISRTRAVFEGTSTPVGVAHHDGITLSQGSGLHQDRGDRATAAVQLGLDDRAHRGSIGVGLGFHIRVRCQQDGFEQQVDAVASLGADRDQRHLAAVLLDDHAALGQLGLDPIGLAIRQIGLVERDHDGDFGSLGVVDGLDGLRHDTVVGGHDEDRDIGDLGTASPHRGEGLVAGRIEEDDASSVDGGLARTDVLGDATALAVSHRGLPDAVEQAGLAMIDVTHHGHDRGSLDELVGIILFVQLHLCGRGRGSFGFCLGFRGRRALGHLEPQLLGDQTGGVAIDGLIDGGEDAAPDELTDDIG